MKAMTATCAGCDHPVKNIGPSILSRGMDRWTHLTPVPAYWSHIARPRTPPESVGSKR